MLTAFPTQHALIEHLQLTDGLSQHNSKLLAASSLTKQAILAKDEKCPLCLRKEWPNQRKFVTHLGRHLEDITLSVIPREVDSDTDQQSDGDEGSVEAKSLCLPPFQSKSPEAEKRLNKGSVLVARPPHVRAGLEESPRTCSHRTLNKREAQVGDLSGTIFCDEFDHDFTSIVEMK